MHGPRRTARYDRDWTQGNITRNFLALSWPMVVSGTLNMMGPTIDMIWVGRLGEASIAGVGISTMVVQLVNSSVTGLFMGMRAMIARLVGAGDPDGANHVARQAFVVSIAFSLVVAAIGIFLAEQILFLFGVAPDVVSEGAVYLRINFIGMVTMSFRMMSEATMNASGDTIRPMRIAIAFRVFHVALAPFLVFGVWVFPRLGVSGAAVTNVFSQALGAGLGFWLLFSGRTRLRMTMRNFRFDPKTTWRMVKIGIPASITNMERTFGQLLLMWFVVPFGTLAVAAHSVGQRIDNFVHNPSMAFGQASGVLGGQNLGARQPERAARTAWTGGGIVTCILVLISVPMFIWAQSVASIFTPKPELQELTGVFIRIVAVGNLFFGLVIVLSQTLNGVGDTFPVMVVTLLGMWAVQVPTAFLLTRFVPSLGVYGVWWAIVSGVFARAIIYTLYFRRGSWKARRV
ncbi:MAG: hypothetical protein A2147_11690 [Chloroflexi bacterium RBG_16_57_8]|nr:MAG: hypothetical protein A2147_11690 [Chloroflexi bacterium RBG_16_57_8]